MASSSVYRAKAATSDLAKRRSVSRHGEIMGNLTLVVLAFAALAAFFHACLAVSEIDTSTQAVARNFPSSYVKQSGLPRFCPTVMTLASVDMPNTGVNPLVPIPQNFTVSKSVQAAQAEEKYLPSMPAFTSQIVKSDALLPKMYNPPSQTHPIRLPHKMIPFQMRNAEEKFQDLGELMYAATVIEQTNETRRMDEFNVTCWNENMKQVETRSLKNESSENPRANADSTNTIVSLITLPRIIYWQTTH